MPPKSLSRRHVLVAIPGAVALMAGVSCGGDDDDTGPTATAAASPSASASAAASTGSAAPVALKLVPGEPAELGAPPVPAATASSAATATPYGPAVAAYAPFGTDAAPGVFPRVVRHAMGEAKLEKKPVRVVTLDSGELDTAVQLGIKPVGVIDYDPAMLPDYLKPGVTDAKMVGPLAEPNLEAIAALRPDVILTTKVRHEKIYDRLNAIAPVVIGISTGVVWKQNFALYARALGREVEAAAVVQRYEDRVKKLNAAFPKPRPTVSVIRVLANNIRYYQRANYSGTLLTDLGFPRPAAQNVDDFALLNQSLETLGVSGEGELIVVSPTEGPQGKFMTEVLNSAVFKSLDGVKKGNVMIVADDVWMAGIGYQAANKIMDQLAAQFKVSG